MVLSQPPHLLILFLVWGTQCVAYHILGGCSSCRARRHTTSQMHQLLLHVLIQQGPPPPAACPPLDRLQALPCSLGTPELAQHMLYCDCHTPSRFARYGVVSRLAAGVEEGVKRAPCTLAASSSLAR